MTADAPMKTRRMSQTEELKMVAWLRRMPDLCTTIHRGWVFGYWAQRYNTMEHLVLCSLDQHGS